MGESSDGIMLGVSDGIMLGASLGIMLGASLGMVLVVTSLEVCAEALAKNAASASKA